MSSATQSKEFPGLNPAFARGTVPPAYTEWPKPETEDPEIFLQRKLGEWVKDVANKKQVFQKHVYDNPNLAEEDLRQHRAHLCFLISNGEWIAIGFIALGEQPGKAERVKPSILLIDQTIQKLTDTFIAWHGPLAVQADVPASFKAAAREVEEGKVVDLDI